MYENKRIVGEDMNYIFSIKNDKNRKIITILGIKIKLKKKDAEIKALHNKISILETKLDKTLRRIDDVFYQQQVLVQVPTVHKYFTKYKNSNEGLDVVLVATGPTLNFYERINNAKHCGVNGAVRITDYLDYLFCIDDPILDIALREEIENYQGNNCLKFFGILPQRLLHTLNKKSHFTERVLPEIIFKANGMPFLIEDVSRNKWAIDLETEAFGEFAGANFCALQFLLYTNPKRIFLVGTDCTAGHAYQDNEVVKKYGNEFKVDIFKQFKQFKDNVYPNTEIISINPVGLKGIFKDVYTKSYLDSNSELRKELGQNVVLLEEIINTKENNK